MSDLLSWTKKLTNFILCYSILTPLFRMIHRRGILDKHSNLWIQPKTERLIFIFPLFGELNLYEFLQGIFIFLQGKLQTGSFIQAHAEMAFRVSVDKGFVGSRDQDSIEISGNLLEMTHQSVRFPIVIEIPTKVPG